MTAWERAKARFGTCVRYLALLYIDDIPSEQGRPKSVAYMGIRDVISAIQCQYHWMTNRGD